MVADLRPLANRARTRRSDARGSVAGMRHRISIVTLLLAVALGACGESDSVTPPETTTTAIPAETTTTAAAPAASNGISITIANFQFSGAATGNVGDEVTVVNADSATHTWTHTDGAFDSGNLSPGDTFTFTFDEAGSFDYFCQIHPGMTGSITIEG
jgi:plastocyanin